MKMKWLSKQQHCVVKINK